MTLVRRYRAPLIAHIHGRTRKRDEAEDIAQEAMCRAWQYLPRLRDPGRFVGWLFRIADNAVLTSARRPPGASLGDEPSGRPHNEPSMNSSVEVHAAVNELSHEHRVVVSLRHYSGMSTEEVAEVLGVPRGTVRSRLSRAYAELRGRLAGMMEV